MSREVLGVGLISGMFREGREYDFMSLFFVAFGISRPSGMDVRALFWSHERGAMVHVSWSEQLSLLITIKGVLGSNHPLAASAPPE